MPYGDQLSRQWRLLPLIDRPAGITVDDAARELDCHRRTIRRDLSVLQDAGATSPPPHAAERATPARAPTTPRTTAGGPGDL